MVDYLCGKSKPKIEVWEQYNIAHSGYANSMQWLYDKALITWDWGKALDGAVYEWNNCLDVIEWLLVSRIDDYDRRGYDGNTYTIKRKQAIRDDILPLYLLFDQAYNRLNDLVLAAANKSYDIVCHLIHLVPIEQIRSEERITASNRRVLQSSIMTLLISKGDLDNIKYIVDIGYEVSDLASLQYHLVTTVRLDKLEIFKYLLGVTNANKDKYNIWTIATNIIHIALETENPIRYLDLLFDLWGTKGRIRGDLLLADFINLFHEEKYEYILYFVKRRMLDAQTATSISIHYNPNTLTWVVNNGLFDNETFMSILSNYIQHDPSYEYLENWCINNGKIHLFNMVKSN
jgi:hypothetical protein